MQTPTPGRIVMVGMDPARNNGHDTAPAVITYVSGERPDGAWTVNVKVLNDQHHCDWKTSVALYADEVSARGAAQGTNTTFWHSAFWPARA